MMDINAAFPSKYVKAADLQGQDVTVTIESFGIEDVDDGEMKPVLRFAGMGRGLVLNRTNANSLEALYGPETDHWVGRSITLYPTTTQFGAKMVACIRIRETSSIASAAPQATQQAAPTAPPASTQQPPTAAPVSF